MLEQEQMARILATAVASNRPVLVNPTADEIRRKAEELRDEGRLTCAFCRKAIIDESFQTRRITFGARLEAVAHLHSGCEADFAAAMQDRAEQSGA